MSQNKKVYKLFNFIPLWSVSVFSNEEKIYNELSERFSKEIDKHINKESLYVEMSDRFGKEFNEKLKQNLR